MTSPDTSAVLHNLEGEQDFDVAWPWWNQVLTPGLTAVLRVKDEARSIPWSLPPVLAATERVVLIDNQSDDGTADVARRVAAELGDADRLSVIEYPFTVSRCGPENLWTPERSVHSLAYFYNWSYSHVDTTYALKWDGDMVLTPEGTAVVSDLQWQLGGEVLVRIPRHPLYVESDRVAYLDRGLANIEPYILPMAPGYGHVKAFDWELQLYPDSITQLRLPEGLCVELKFLDAEEFSHWTEPDAFADSVRTQRKRREWEVFHTLAAGRSTDVDLVERIEAPPGVHVVDHVTRTWLPRSSRPVYVRAAARSVATASKEAAPALDPSLTPGRSTTSTTSTDDPRRVLLVVGSGRSGTSTLAGIMSQLGMHVPEPQVVADPSNPRGFSEPAWVVDFHTRLLNRHGIEVSDARPQCWFEAARLSALPRPRQNLYAWLHDQFAVADELVVKDPRLAWFLGMWRAAAVRAGCRPGFATMLRHPTEVVSSKARQYPGPAGNTNRAAGWVNMMLFTERATRGSDRAFVAYRDLLANWAAVVRPAAERLRLSSVIHSDAQARAAVDQFIQPSLATARGSWDDLGVQRVICDLAEETWSQLSPLADPAEDTTARAVALDALRAEYTTLYAEAEGLAMSSIDAARPSSAPHDAFLVDLERADADRDSSAG